MRAVDINPKGNVIRIYLTNREDLSEVWGDDWDDQGCTDTVYSKYVDGYKDIIFNFHTEVFNCEDYIDGYNTHACKEDMKNGMFPMITAIPAEKIKDRYGLGFKDIMAMKDATKIYFGDELEPDEVPLKEKEINYIKENSRAMFPGVFFFILKEEYIYNE